MCVRALRILFCAIEWQTIFDVSHFLLKIETCKKEELSALLLGQLLGVLALSEINSAKGLGHPRACVCHMDRTLCRHHKCRHPECVCRVCFVCVWGDGRKCVCFRTV